PDIVVGFAEHGRGRMTIGSARSHPVDGAWLADLQLRPLTKGEDAFQQVVRHRDLFVAQIFFFSSRRRHTILQGDWSSDVCSSDLILFDYRGEDPKKPTSPSQGAVELVRLPEGSIDGQVRIVVTIANQPSYIEAHLLDGRSEERRVGKECRAWWSSCHEETILEDIH